MIRGIVLADDDLNLPKNWITDLLRVAQENPENIVAWRCKTVLLGGCNSEPHIEKYEKSQQSGYKARPGYKSFATSGSGTFVPPRLANCLWESLGIGHLSLAPTGDDVYLHASTLTAKVKTVGASSKHLDWPRNPLKGVGGLRDENVALGRNDSAIKSCYSKAEFELFLKKTLAKDSPKKYPRLLRSWLGFIR